MHQQLLSGTAALVLLALGGCSQARSAQGERQEAVIGGQDSGFSRAEVLYVTSEVGTVAGNTIVKIGSGSLIAPNLLLTALHVVSQNPSNIPFTCDAAGNEVSGSKGSELGSTVAPEKVAVYAGPIPGSEPLARGVRIVSSGSTTICKNDLAFVVLDEALDLPVLPIRRGSAVSVGDAVTVIGYGTEPGMDVAARTEREVRVSAVGQWIRTFTVSTGPCEGDSGGPALDANGEIAGVFSTVGSDCTSPTAAAKYTDLSYFELLVEQAFDAAGAGSPWKSETQPGGNAGQAGQASSNHLSADAGAGGAPEPAQEPPLHKDSSCSSTSRSAHAGSSFGVLWLGAGLAWRRAASRRKRPRSGRRITAATGHSLRTPRAHEELR